MSENGDIPILSNLEKKLILILGESLIDFNEISRYSSTSIKIALNEYNEKYNLPYRSNIPYSTLKNLEQKELIDSVYDRENGRIKKFYLLTKTGIQWFYRARRIEKEIFSR